MLEVSGFHFSKYPNRIRKKTKFLNYPNTIPEILSEFGYAQDFFYVPRTIRRKNKHLELSKYYPILQGLSQIFLDTWNISLKNYLIIMLLKKPNTLNYPILFLNIAKFFQIVFRYLKHLDRLLEESQHKFSQDSAKT